MSVKMKAINGITLPVDGKIVNVRPGADFETDAKTANFLVDGGFASKVEAAATAKPASDPKADSKADAKTGA